MKYLKRILSFLFRPMEKSMYQLSMDNIERAHKETMQRIDKRYAKMVERKNEIKKASEKFRKEAGCDK